MCCTFVPTRKYLRYLRFHLKRLVRLWLTLNWFVLLNTKTAFHIAGRWCSYPYAITNIYLQGIQGIYPVQQEFGLPKETGVASYFWITLADNFHLRDLGQQCFKVWAKRVVTESGEQTTFVLTSNMAFSIGTIWCVSCWMINSINVVSIYFPCIGTETNIRTLKWQSLQPLLLSASREQGPGGCRKNTKGERTIPVSGKQLISSLSHRSTLISQFITYSNHFEFYCFQISCESTF